MAKSTDKTDKKPAGETETPAASTSDKKTESAEVKAAATAGASAKPNVFKRFGRYYTTHKKWTIPVTILLLLLTLAIIPATRYYFAGLFVEKDYSVTVNDSSNGLPVSGADVSLAGVTAKTDNRGKATLHTKVGYQTLGITKKYYKDVSQDVTVALDQNKNSTIVKMVATGRQVPLVLQDKITGKPVENATVKAEGTEAKTDAKGMVTMVLPPEKATVEATVSADGYNDAKATIKVTTLPVAENTFKITPAGKLYFLSKRTGKIDVMKSDLDGANQVVVLKGTGFESDTETVLLASRDWNYLALKAKRDDKKDYAALYIIDTQNGDKLITADEGNASFTLSGWLDHYIVYQVEKNDSTAYQGQSGHFKVKSYNASTGKLSTLDQSNADGNAGQYSSRYEYFTNVYITAKTVLYGKTWNCYGYCDMAGKQHAVYSIAPDASNKKTVIARDATNTSSVDLKPYKLNDFYIKFILLPDYNSSFSEYEADTAAVKNAAINDVTYNKPYPTPLVSPSGDKSFWSDERDGKGNIIVADGKGENEKTVAALEDMTAYGWYTDNYLLLSKKGSELYIMPVTGGDTLKITDYHKPSVSFYGYGYGYGGF